MLPHDLPPWGTVHYYYRRFRRDGTWREGPRPLAHQGAPGRRSPPRAPCGHPGQPVGQDDQKGGPERGYDAVKKVNGRKRHLLVDTLGLILAVLVHGADVGEREGARWLLEGVLAAKQASRRAGGALGGASTRGATRGTQGKRGGAGSGGPW